MHKNPLALLGYQTSDNLLSDILRRIVKKFFELGGGKLLNDLLFSADSIRVVRLKQVQSILLLVVVLDQASAPVSHLTKSVGEAESHLRAVCARRA